MRHIIAVAQFKIELFIHKDANAPALALAVLGFQLGIIAVRMISTLA